MPLINYSVLASLVHEHQQLVDHAYPLEPSQQSRLEDLLYTLGVYTGFREPQEAVTEAHRLLNLRLGVEPASA
ncbi:DUF5133 domain-containing protein [Wenjunlia tyrosinilytica]|jgi:hypothetical protein|uniref:Uncharacterized protein n=1 Tax=Wenjunlia tyrosinilytica TaxID=1544741 RepID=A0A917ZT95_9ACTN|nr:DUF5133 domain-containing protein [Wenjunlia tyrosinilytica]GGO90868.1 hypothetical protein GCM10012280_37390 [Wenjunlia tyrosinilytica]